MVLEKVGEDQLDRSCENRVLYTVKAEGNILYARKRMKANCNGHILRCNCHLNHIIEGDTEIK